MEAIRSTLTDSLDFRRVDLGDMQRLTDVLASTPLPSCDYSLGGILIWRDWYGYHVAISDNILFIRGRDPKTGTLLYYAPCGNIAYDEALDMIRADAHGRDFVVVQWCEDWLDSTPHLDLHQNEEPRHDLDDYVYDINSFQHFSGKKMEKKRNHLNYFNNHYTDAIISDITTCDIPEIEAFTRSLDKMHEPEPMFLYENRHCTDLLPYLDDLGLIGVVVRCDGKVIGYAWGEVIGNMFFAHVEKGNVEYRGIYQKLASEMAVRAIALGAEYENREDDTGNESLRKSKESYHPVMMVRKYYCR